MDVGGRAISKILFGDCLISLRRNIMSELNFVKVDQISELDVDEVKQVVGGLRKQTLPSGTVVYRDNGPVPVGYDDVSTGTCHG